MKQLKTIKGMDAPPVVVEEKVKEEKEKNMNIATIKIESINNGYLISYDTPFGSGKTSCSDYDHIKLVIDKKLAKLKKYTTMEGAMKEAKEKIDE